MPQLLAPRQSAWLLSSCSLFPCGAYILTGSGAWRADVSGAILLPTAWLVLALCGSGRSGGNRMGRGCLESRDSVSHCGHVTTSESPFSRPTPRGCDLSSSPHGGVPRYPLAGRGPPEGADRPDELGLRGKGTQPLPLPTSSHRLLQLTTPQSFNPPPL